MASGKKKTGRKKPASPEASGEPTFEDALAELEALVERLEEGEVPLEESLEAYARGTRLVKLCMERLARAESTIRELHASTQGFTLRASTPDAENGEDDEIDEDGEGPEQDDLGF